MQLKQYDYDLISIPVKDLKYSSLNPAERTDKVKSLALSFKKTGVITPVLITEDNKLIDGHRRATALSYIDPEAHIPALVIKDISSKKEYEELFMHTNDGVMKMSPSQELEIYLKGGHNRISDRTRNCNTALKTLGGTPILKRINQEHKSPFTYLATVNMYASYTGRVTKRALRKVLYWVFNIGSAYTLKSAMSFMIPREEVVRAVEERKELSLVVNFDGGDDVLVNSDKETINV